ncbi:lysosome membrane protein 2 [Sarcoptes scabiei]|nr:lysosome membrane protein 2 [Sarcoptes scabiei]
MATVITENSTSDNQLLESQMNKPNAFYLGSMLKPSSSLSIEEYSSRYSSLQDTDSLKSAIFDSFRMHWLQAWSIMRDIVHNDESIKIERKEKTDKDYDDDEDNFTSILNHIEQMFLLLSEESKTFSLYQPIDLKTEPNDSIVDDHPHYVLYEHHHYAQSTSNASTTSTSSLILSPLLEFLSDEMILWKLYLVAMKSNKWKPKFFLEELKIFEIFFSRFLSHFLCQSMINDFRSYRLTIIQPLICLLDSISKYLTTLKHQQFDQKNFDSIAELENRSVLLINHLCAILNHHRNTDSSLINLLIIESNSFDDSLIQSNDLSQNKLTASIPTISFSYSSLMKMDSNPDFGEINRNEYEIIEDAIKTIGFSFPIVSLLSKFIHREDSIGNLSRDAILISLSLSASEDRIARFIAFQTDLCPIIASSLTGHFSSLPRIEHNESRIDLERNLSPKNELDIFLRFFKFTNTVVQCSNPIIQAQLLKFIYDGFLVSVIGPSLNQSDGQIPEALNFTIGTTTTYLDLLIKTIFEPKLLQIFLRFLCFHSFDSKRNNVNEIHRPDGLIIDLLIERVRSTSNFSLHTLILFETLIDLRCEDLFYELIFKHLLKGDYLRKNQNVNVPSPLYRKNWLLISAQKLLSSTVSYYLGINCLAGSRLQPRSDQNQQNECIRDFLEYLHESRQQIEQCHLNTKLWRNNYSLTFEINHNLDRKILMEENDIVFSVQDDSYRSWNDRYCSVDNNNDTSPSLIFDSIDEKENRKNFHEVSQLITKRNNSFAKTQLLLDQSISKEIDRPHQLGLFLSMIFEKLEEFFQNDWKTNLHLTGLMIRLCHYPFSLILSLFFDETLPRLSNSSCFLHILQRLSLQAQKYCDEISNFETLFILVKKTLKSERRKSSSSPTCILQSLDIMIETTLSTIEKKSNNLNQKEDDIEMSAAKSSGKSSARKAFGMLKNLFSRSNHHQNYGKKERDKLTKSKTINDLYRIETKKRFDSISSSSTLSSINSAQCWLEVVPDGSVRFINQNNGDYINDKKLPSTDRCERLIEIIANLIVFDEFLTELSATLIEHSVYEIAVNLNEDNKSVDGNDDCEEIIKPL